MMRSTTGKVADDANGGTEDDGFFSTAELLKLGQQVGLNMTTFTSCVQNNTDGNLVAQEKGAAASAGVNSTPMFFVNGAQITGAEPYTTSSRRWIPHYRAKGRDSFDFASCEL